MRKWSSILDSVWSRLEIEFWFRFSGGDIAATVGIINCNFICMCAYIFSLLMYLYLCRCLNLRMMREGDFCLVGGDTAATIWGQYFSEIRGPVRFTKYFTIRYNIFPYFTIWGCRPYSHQPIDFKTYYNIHQLCFALERTWELCFALSWYDVPLCYKLS